MLIHIEALPTIVFAATVVSWFAFVIAFLTRKKPPQSPDKKRDPRSITGIALQGVSYATVWAAHRPYFTSLVRGPGTLEIIVSVVTVAVAFGSLAFTMAAVNTLGKEWSLTARVVEGHKLATSGPYALVRHPIYTGMLGMLVATGLAVSYWPALVVAVVVFFVGTIIRIRIEEGLLRETFGAEFDDYARNVAAIVPVVF